MTQKKLDEFEFLLKKHFFVDSYNKSEKVPRTEWENIMKKVFNDKCSFVWKGDKVSQLDFGSDLLLTTDKGRKYSVDVKTRHQDYYGFEEWLLEIVHHRYRNESKKEKINTTPGWLYKSTSDIIFIGTVDDIDDPTKLLECVCFSLIPFKNENFKSTIGELYNGWASTEFENGIFQLTLNKRVPLKFLEEHANFFKYIKNERDGIYGEI